MKPFQAPHFLDIANGRPLDEMLKKLTEIYNYTNKYLLNFIGNTVTLILFNLLNIAWSHPDRPDFLIVLEGHYRFTEFP